MMRTSASPALRFALRTRGAGQKRLASTSTSEAAQAAQKRAQEAASNAQKQAERLWEASKTYLGPLGERVGNLLGAYRQPIVYNFQVARELLKQVYVREGLAPPTSVSAFTSAYSELFARARSPAYWRGILGSGEWARVGVYAVEAYGIFKIGEIIGRRSLVGYKLRDN
ncbi:hypothetical protein CONPUDRAFT_80289 [Coniophora puteana RWD-64-598 SS2]|uniref:Mitochondrial F1F0-ATP synthase g subunit n=1 Tax=Coniophora puteana (strain RWD-64-598) TaxID=741705 RepID=A0A5M3MX17_CONPW|nr:uncharacterized protein CONPUDRAFT_80289 [Coniophora puteana RWD-64-598 SS2]EIW83620.1 hypothetical protein CONPUDRAFT_80289 [Coniophora puteana RWD-64-598 SS2]